MKRSTRSDSAEPLRLAFSELEKARTLSEECMRARAEGTIDDARAHALYEFYGRHIQKATEKIDILREEHRRRAVALHKAIQDAAREQLNLSDRATHREIDPQKANQLNRELTARIADLRASLIREERLVSATDAQSLGGRIEMPLESYTLDRPARRTPRSISAGHLAGTFVPLLLSLSVFLPWLAVDGRGRSLAGLAGLPLIHDAGLNRPVFVVLLAFFVAWPFVGAISTWLESRRVGGWGLAVVGALAFAIALCAELVLLRALATPSDFAAALAAVRPGAAIYALGGLTLIYLGVRRIRTATGVADAWTPSTALTMTAVVAAVAVIGTFAFLGVNPPETVLTFDGSVADRTTGLVRIECSNPGPAPVHLFVPWPGGTASEAISGERRNTYGVLVYVRESSGTALRLYPASSEGWARDGLPLQTGTSVEIAPGTTASLVFDPRALKNQGISATALSFTLTGASGRSLASFEADVAPAGSERRP